MYIIWNTLQTRPNGTKKSIRMVCSLVGLHKVLRILGVQVLVDSKALLSIIGSEMDYVEDPLSARFVFNNPNIKETCGCGLSFMI